MRTIGKSFVSNLLGRQQGFFPSTNVPRQPSVYFGLVKRLSLHNRLERHKGLVNSIHFNTSGDFLASGGDDSIIEIWDWDKVEKKIAYRSDHMSDVLQVKQKFMNCNV